MAESRPKLLVPALIGGSVTGLAAALPFLSCLQAVCCAWTVSGSLLACYLASKSFRTAGEIFTIGTGVVVGCLSGVFHILVSGATELLVNSVMRALGQPAGLEGLEQLLDEPSVPEGVKQVVESLIAIGPAGLFVIGAVVLMIFAALGGLLGGIIFRSRPPAP